MELTMEFLKKIRTLTITALFSDDDLMDTFVLKGGNALEIGYGLNSRASIDVDVSMVKELKELGISNLHEFEDRLANTLTKSFEPDGFRVFDVKVKEKPKKSLPELEKFWGGYEATFKIIEKDKYEQYKGNYDALAAKAIATNNDKKNVKIDFGRFEYCGSTIDKDLGGFDIQIYTPELIVFEKIRAICQQMPSYLTSIGKDPSFGRPRPRDFYDIYTVLESDKIPKIDIGSDENKEHLIKCFEAKRVPFDLINEIKNTRDFHAMEEAKLKDAILNKSEYKGFDFYFNYVVKLIEQKISIPEKI